MFFSISLQLLRDKSSNCFQELTLSCLYARAYHHVNFTTCDGVHQIGKPHQKKLVGHCCLIVRSQPDVCAYLYSLPGLTVQHNTCIIMCVCIINRSIICIFVLVCSQEWPHLGRSRLHHQCICVRVLCPRLGRK